MFARTRTPPSQYAGHRVLFHAVRTAQSVSSLVVGSIMSFFIWHSTHDHWHTPWTFIVLTAVSLLTVLILSLTIILHFFTGSNSRSNLALNTLLFGLWAMGFGMLSWSMWGTSTHFCDMRNWNDSTGIMVCRIYKALFTFSLSGLLSTLTALSLDLYIRRLTNHRGAHHRLDDLDHKRRPATRGPYTDMDHQDSAVWDNGEEEDANAGHGWPSAAFDVPSGYGESSGSGGGAGAGSTRKQGYAVPEGQFGYDTEYRGAHGELSG